MSIETEGMRAIFNSLLGGVVPADTFLQIALRWWQGDILGIVFLTPMILIWICNRQDIQPTSQGVEMIGLSILSLLTGQVVFFEWFESWLHITPDPIWLVPFIIWSGLRLGRNTVAFIQLVIFIQALWGASLGIGPYAHDLTESGLLNFWMFGMMVAVGGMAIAIISDENRKALNLLKTNEQSLREYTQILEQKEGYLRALIDNFPFMVWLKDTESRFLAVNQALAETLGECHPDALHGKSDFDYSPLELAEHYQRDDQTVLSSRQRKIVEEEHVDHFGHRRWIETFKAPVIDARGKPLGTVGFARDISERKTAEEQLTKALSQIKTLLKTIPDLVWLKDTHGFYLSCNTRFENFFGKKETEIIGKTDYAFLEPSLADLIRANDQQSMENNAPTVNEEWITFAEDGHQELLEIIKTPMFDPNGKVIGILCIGHDITKRKQLEKMLSQQENHLRAILESTSECVKLVSADGTIVSMNRAGLELLEADDPDRIINQNIYNLIAPEYQEPYRVFNERVCEGHAGSTQFEIIGLKGRRRWMETQAVPFHPQDSNHPLQLAFTQEITNRKLLEDQLNLAASVFTHAHEGIVITDPQATIINVNQTYCDITGYSREEVVGKNPRILKSGRHSKEFYNSLWSSLIESGNWSGELWNRRKNGEVYAQLLTISAVLDQNGVVQNYVGLFNDITQMKLRQQRMEHIAHYDALTGLPNRLLLADRLQQAMNSCQRQNHQLSIVYIDLDGFKAINDEYGHEMGDRLLITLANRMRRVIRDSDTLARIGGDEFIGVLIDIENSQSPSIIIQRLLEAAADPVHLDGLNLHVSASIGISKFPDDGNEADLLIRHADQAMYQAKQAGKNQFQIFSDQNIQNSK